MILKSTSLLYFTIASAAVTEPVSECGHFHTKCIAPEVRTHEDYKLFAYPLHVNFAYGAHQFQDLTFHSLYNQVIWKKIGDMMAAGMTKDQAKAQMTAATNNPQVNATLVATAMALSIDEDKLRTHGCWCSKGLSDPDTLGRKTGGRVTDMVDYVCKKYIERNECYFLKGGICENYKLEKPQNGADWRIVSPSGESFSEYWAKVWLGPIGLLIPEEAVYIEDNDDACMVAKARSAYELVQRTSQLMRGGSTPEGLANFMQGKNPFQTNWDGWKPNAVCGNDHDFEPVFHKKRCDGHPPHVMAVWDDL